MSRVICQMAASPPHTHLCTSLYSLHFSGRVHDPLKSTPSVRDSGPHLIRGFFGSHVSAAEPHLDWFRSCCTAYLSAKHIPVDHTTCDMHNKGPRVSTHCYLCARHIPSAFVAFANLRYINALNSNNINNNTCRPRHVRHAQQRAACIYALLPVCQTHTCRPRQRLGQLSLASLRGRLIEYQLWLR